ncbi:MAG: cation:proton antiporter [Patescibacteria group bacterium]|jgi:Kef-type K+ transport system membrane component KefB|nr:cation:proton antiporter [Patescibacteria group bacterium]
MVLESSVITLLIVLSIGLLLPELFKKLRLPFLTFIILAGAALGPNGLNYIQSSETISVFGFLGMAFLMFMAGLETDITQIYKSKNKIVLMALFNSLFPFLTGLLITRLFGYSWIESLVVGVVFISSSVAIIFSSIKDNKQLSKDTLQLILSAVMVTDIISLVAIGFLFQTDTQITKFPLPIYLLILLVSIVLLFKIIPIISKKILKKRFLKNVGYERRLRYVVIVLISVVAYFSFLGAHPILASFLAGLSLSGVISSGDDDVLMHKIHTIGYGLFIPVFFFVVGMEIDLGVLKDFDAKNLLIILLILGLLVSKFVSGYISGRLSKISKKESLIFGSISITQLTTTLAVTYTASSVNLLSPTLITGIILLAIITTIVGPILSSYVAKLNI